MGGVAVTGWLVREQAETVIRALRYQKADFWVFSYCNLQYTSCYLLYEMNSSGRYMFDHH